MSTFTGTFYRDLSATQKARLLQFSRRYASLVWLRFEQGEDTDRRIGLACASLLGTDFSARLHAWVASGEGVMPDLAAIFAGDEFKDYIAGYQACIRYLAAAEVPRSYWRSDESDSRLLALQKQSFAYDSACADDGYGYMIGFEDKYDWLCHERSQLEKLREPSAEERCRLVIVSDLERYYSKRVRVEIQEAWDLVAQFRPGEKYRLSEERYQELTELYIIFMGEWQRLAEALAK